MIVYKLTNLVNGKIYVGQTTRSLEKRFKEHSHCKTSLIGQAIHEFGEENFSREVLVTCDSKEETDNLEVFSYVISIAEFQTAIMSLKAVRVICI